MKNILNFLNELNENNNRDWFIDNKDKYETAKNQFEELVNILIMKIKEFDPVLDVNSAKECAFRIYRDVRFSKNKEPYKTNMGAYIAKGGRKSELAGYYIHIQPGESFAGGGLYCPQTKVLKAVRDDIFHNSSQIKKIINNKEFNTAFPQLYGEKLKTAPKGYPKDFPDIDLLNYKSYTVIKPFSDKEILSLDFLDKVLAVFKIQKPLNDYLNNVIKA